MMQKIDKKKALLAIVIFLVAFLPRFLVVFHSSDTPKRDAAGYDDLAVNLINGRGFSVEGQLTSWREPLYPLFLASVYSSWGHNYKIARVAQAVMGAAVCVLIFFISEVIFDKKTGILSALIASFSPGLIKINEYLLSENLFIFLFIFAIFLLARQRYRHDFKNLIFIGILVGLTSLTRSLFILFPFFIFLFMRGIFLSPMRNGRRYMANASILLLSFVLTILPWSIRNWRVHHKIIPISSRGGDGLYLSYVLRDGKFFEFDPQDPVILKARLINSESERSKFLFNETIKYIMNNPYRLLKIETLKMLYFWSPFDWEILGYGVYNFMYCFILPFFILGIFATSKRFKELLPVFLPIVYVVFVSAVTFGSPRFRLPVEPYIIIIAAAGIWHFSQYFSKKAYPFLIISSYFLLNLYLYFNSYQVKIIVRSFFEKINIW